MKTSALDDAQNSLKTKLFESATNCLVKIASPWAMSNKVFRAVATMHRYVTLFLSAKITALSAAYTTPRVVICNARNGDNPE